MKMGGAGKKPTTIHFVGAGPGDPELITLKGFRLLREADVVVYTGSLVMEKLIMYAPDDAEILNSAPMTLEEITGAMVRGAREGKRVVRLHTGDPSLYSAMREQADILDMEEVPYEVVPGVSSASAAAAALKKEFTMPEVTQTVIYTRLEGKTPVPDPEKLKLLSRHAATVCVFLSAAMIERVVEELSEGYAPETPAAVVYRASWEDELVIKGTLKDIAGKVKEAGINKHAIIVVGRAIGESDGPKRSKLYDGEFKHGFRR